MAYKAPIWEDGKSPAISAKNLNNLSQAAEGAQVLYGNSAPTSSTEGAVGQFYLVVVADSDGNYPLYQCVAITNGSYVWRDTRRIPDSITSMLGIPAPGTINSALNVLVGALNATYVLASSGVTVTAQSGNDTRTAVAASNGTATFKGLSSGDWMFSATISGAVKSKSVTIDTQREQYLSLLPLNDLNWTQIDTLGAAGVLGEMFALGDTKDVTLSGIGTMTLQIADFDHDYLSGTTTANKAAVTFLCKNLLYQPYQMNSIDTNNGGFPSSSLRNTLYSSIYDAMPNDLKVVIKSAYKWYGTGNNTTNGRWSGQKLWFPLTYEVFGSNGSAPAEEQTTGNARQYPIFTNNDSRIKKMANGAGSANPYWLASPYAKNSTGFCSVLSDGSANASSVGASYNYGVCFGLCV